MFKQLLLYLLVFNLSVFSAPTSNVIIAAKTPDNTQTLKTVNVNGLVCDFCARSLEKVLRKDPSIKDVSINLKTKVVIIYLNQNKSLTDQHITRYINDAGYSVESIKSSKKTISPTKQLKEKTNEPKIKL